MSIHNPNPVTYADWAKTRDPDGGTADIVEILEQLNPILKDVTLRESNKTEGEETTVRAGEPRGTWVAHNEGALPTKAHSRQVFDKPGRLLAYNEVAKSLADLENDKAAFMLSESTSQMEGMMKDHAEALFYGNSIVNPKRFMGMMPRYNDVNAESGRNILNGQPGGGQPPAVSSTSIYSITWGRQTAYEFFPKGSMAGLDMRDLGEHTGYDANGGRLQIYRVMFEHFVGFTVKDWRAHYRIAQLETADINADTVDLVKLLIKAQHRTRKTNMGQQVIYCNEAVYTSLDVRASQTSGSNVHLDMREWAGEEIVHFRGIPIRMCEAILGTEDVVTGLTATDIT